MEPTWSLTGRLEKDPSTDPSHAERQRVEDSGSYVQVHYCFMSAEAIRTLRDGEPRTATSTFNTAPELWRQLCHEAGRSRCVGAQTTSLALGPYLTQVTALSVHSRAINR